MAPCVSGLGGLRDRLMDSPLGAVQGLGWGHACSWGGGCPQQGGVLELGLGLARGRHWSPSEHTGVCGGLLPSSGVCAPLPQNPLGRRRARRPQGCLLPSKEPTGPSLEQGLQSQQPTEGPLAPALEHIIILRPCVSLLVFARGACAEPCGSARD